MLIFACDICKKEIKDRNKVMHLMQELSNLYFCDKCSKPIHMFLKKHGLIKQEVSLAEGLKKKVGLATIN